MKRFLVSMTFLLAFAGISHAEKYRISLLTCGPGDELYSTFGHSAMRVRDLEAGTEAVYNFGMFNFSDPNFYMKFLKGDLDYYLGLQNFGGFVREYTYEQRYVYEQVLNLTDAHAEEIVSRLECRNRPENRAYKYKFIQRNCTTELRDIIVDVVDADEGFLLAPDILTWRDYLSLCLYEKPWTKMGVNILLGSRVDREINNFEKMCLPELLYRGLPDIAENLVAEETVINEDTRGPLAGRMGRSYHIIILAVLALVLVFVNSRVVDSVYCFLLGTLGLLVVFLMFYGTHMEFKANFNLLWCNPALIVLGIAILRKRPKLIFIMSSFSLLCLLTLLVIWVSGVQGMDSSFLVPVVALMYISLKYFRGCRKAALGMFGKKA